MPTPQQTHMTPLPMPTPTTVSPGELGPPAGVSNWQDSPAAPPMAPPVAPSGPPPNASAALEPTWRAAGIQFAADSFGQPDGCLVDGNVIRCALSNQPILFESATHMTCASRESLNVNDD